MKKIIITVISILFLIVLILSCTGYTNQITPIKERGKRIKLVDTNDQGYVTLYIYKIDSFEYIVTHNGGITQLPKSK